MTALAKAGLRLETDDGFEVARAMELTAQTALQFASELLSPTRQHALVALPRDVPDFESMCPVISGMARTWAFDPDDADLASALVAVLPAGDDGNLAPLADCATFYLGEGRALSPEGRIVVPAERTQAVIAIGALLCTMVHEAHAPLTAADVHRISEECEAARRDREQPSPQPAEQPAERHVPTLAEPSPQDAAQAARTAIDALLAAATSTDAASAEAIREAEQAREELTAANAKLASSIERAEGLEREVERLRAEAEAEAAENASWHAERDAALAKAAHVDDLTALVGSLKAENARLRERESALWDLTSLPSDEASALELAARAFPERIVVLKDAFDAARVHGGDADEAWRIARAMATVLWELRFGEGSPSEGRLSDAFRARTGFEVSLHEKELTKAMERQRRHTYKGERIVCEAHVKGSANPRDPIRAYFAFDDDARLVVIGHFGRHLTTSGSRRKGY